MTPTELRPVLDQPALLLDPGRPNRPRRLITADLHLGLGETGPREGLPSATSARQLVEDLLRLAREAGVRHLVIAGDVKHPIVGTPRALRPVIFDAFSMLLSEGLAVDVVLGNHDVGLVRHLPREVRVHDPDGVVLDGVGIFHGHRWPSPRVLGAAKIVAGHLHPGVRLAPSPERPTGKERCWVRVAFSAPPQGTRRTARVLLAREMVILPAFNPLAGTEALNRGRPKRGRSFLYQRFLGRGDARTYLLDGTDLGPLVTPTRAPPSGCARGVGRGR
ncbi:MAG TPA: hypothetical protein VFG07_00440 [Thermoplasmata archaeon]|nr:hypothetical protein [Thermoplasmata archaeon]